MKIVILNQFAPPDDSPTARLAGELGEALESGGHRVTLISCPPGYRERRRGSLRIFAEVGSWCGLLLRSLRVANVDVWVVFTSPPLVVWVALVAARLRGGRVVHWVLDAYPDIAHVLGALPSGPVLQILRAGMRRAYRKCNHVVAVCRTMAEWLEREYGVEASVIYPWPPEVKNSLPAASNSSDPKTWLVSGNLGRAHDWKTLLDAQQHLEDRGAGWRLVVQGGGSGWEAARKSASERGFREVVFQPYVDTSDLMASLRGADVRVVTCRKEVAGLLWPSKLALLRALPGPHLWIGPHLPEDDLGSEFFQFLPGEAEKIADWLQQMESQSMPGSGEAVEESIDRLRRQGVTFWQDLINRSGK